MGASKNVFRGIMFTTMYIMLTMVIPFLTFTWISNLGTLAGGGDIAIGMSPDKYKQIVFWILAFGSLISGTAFFAYSSPSQSIRRGLFALIQVLLNCGYIWSYKFSGALELDFELLAYYDGTEWQTYVPEYPEASSFEEFPVSATNADYDFHIYMVAGDRLSIPLIGEPV